ncbi:MAG: hypothetical protein ACYDHW_16685 [Syntrophorhabdaceae bacterium]
MYGNLKKILFCSLIALIFVAFFIQGTASAQEAGKLSGYVTLDQNQITYRTAQACQATVTANGRSRTICAVDPKFGGSAGFAYNCGARTFTEISGYWANNGYPGLMPTGVLPSGALPDYSEQTLALFNVAGVKYTTYGDYDSYFNCHNCAAEFTAYTDHSRSTVTNLLDKVAAYFTANGYSATVTAKDLLPEYEEIKAEIVAGRPVALSMRECDHWVTVIGYNDIGPNLIALIGHEGYVSDVGCPYLNTDAGVYEAEFPYSSLVVSGNIAVFITPAPTPSPAPSTPQSPTAPPPAFSTPESPSAPPPPASAPPPPASAPPPPALSLPDDSINWSDEKLLIWRLLMRQSQ